MNINEVKHDKCDWSSDTSLYLQSGINVLSACHFTYSPKTRLEQDFRKSLIISYRVNALQLNFLEILRYRNYIVVSQKFKLKLISAKFLLPMIFRNELSITLSTLWSGAAVIIRSCLLPAMWVGQHNNRSQPCRLQKSRPSRSCRSVGVTVSNHAETFDFLFWLQQRQNQCGYTCTHVYTLKWLSYILR